MFVTLLFNICPPIASAHLSPSTPALTMPPA